MRPFLGCSINDFTLSSPPCFSRLVLISFLLVFLSGIDCSGSNSSDAPVGNRRIWAWGRNKYSECLFDPDERDPSSRPTLVLLPESIAPVNSTILAVQGGHLATFFAVESETHVSIFGGGAGKSLPALTGLPDSTSSSAITGENPALIWSFAKSEFELVELQCNYHTCFVHVLCVTECGEQSPEIPFVYGFGDSIFGELLVNGETSRRLAPRLLFTNASLASVTWLGAVLFRREVNQLQTVGHPMGTPSLIDACLRDPLSHYSCYKLGRLGRSNFDEALEYRPVNMTYLSQRPNGLEDLSIVRITHRALFAFFDNGDYYISSMDRHFVTEPELWVPCMLPHPWDTQSYPDSLQRGEAEIYSVKCTTYFCIAVADDILGPSDLWAFSWGDHIRPGNPANPEIPTRLARGDIPNGVSVIQVHPVRGRAAYFLTEEGEIFVWSDTDPTPRRVWGQGPPEKPNLDLRVLKIDAMGDAQYFGFQDTVVVCFGHLKTSPLVCNRNGVCASDDECECTGQWFGEQCTDRRCGGIHHLDESVCNGHGTCDAPDRCGCFADWAGKYCSRNFTCNGVWKYSPVVCSEHGSCDRHTETNEPYCACEPGKYGGNDCQSPICAGILSTDPSVCNRNGLCHSPGSCKCDGPSGDGLQPCGLMCLETVGIEGKFVDEQHQEIQTVYVVPMASIESKFSEPFDCELVLMNAHILGGKENIECSLTRQSSMSDFLVIELKEQVFSSRGILLGKSGKDVSLIIRPLTVALSSSASDFVLVTVLPFVPETPRVVTGSWPYYLAGFGGTGALCFVVVLVLVFFLVSCRNRRKLHKFNKLDDVDLLLEEQIASSRASLLTNEPDEAVFDLSFDDLRLVRTIGTGGSGATVYSGEWNSEVVAIKVFNLNGFDRMAMESIERELNILTTVHHANIVRYLGAAYRKPRIAVVMEFCGLGDLRQYLTDSGKEIPREKVSLQTRVSILEGTAAAMSFLHAKQLIHRDLKPENILVREDLTAAVMDFGLARAIRQADLSKTGAIGTVFYMAPEMVLGEDYDGKIDVFSFGIVLFAVVSLNFHPYGRTTMNVEYRVANDPLYRPPEHGIEDERLRSLAVSCWQHDPQDRPSFGEIRDVLATWLKEEIRQ